MSGPTATTRVKTVQSPNIPGLHITVITGAAGYVRVTANAAIVPRVIYNGGTNPGSSTAAMAGNASVSPDVNGVADSLAFSAAPLGASTGPTGGIIHNLGEGAACPNGFGVTLANASDSVTVLWK
jgi:hypothetical protein